MQFNSLWSSHNCEEQKGTIFTNDEKLLKWSGIVKFGSVSVSDVKFVREIKSSPKITILMSEIAFLEDRYKI